MKKTIALLFLVELLVVLGFTSAYAQAKTITQTSGDGQTQTVSTPLSQAYVVTVTDAIGDPVAGVAVDFAIVGAPTGATGESLSSPSVLTDINGQAASTLTLGNKVGTYSVNATSAGLTGSPVVFTATATAGPARNITLTSGDGQSGTVTSQLVSQMVVTVTDVSGNPVSGRSVTFSIFSSPSGAIGQAVAPTTDITDVNGQASTLLTLGTKRGTYTVHATSAGLIGSPVTFTATANSGTATQVRVETLADGTGTIVLPQNLASGSSLTVYAITRDLYDNFVANVAADAWALINRTGGVGPPDLVPAGNSLSATFKGDTVGTAQIQATEGILTKIPSGTITVFAGTASKVRVETQADGFGKVVPDTSLVSGSSLTAYAISRDASSNFVGIVSGTWSLTSKTGGVADGDLSPLSGTSTSFTAHLSGSAVIHVTSGGLTPGNSGTVTVGVGTAKNIALTSGNGQSGPVSTPLTNPFVITVTDASGNPVAGTAVTFAVATFPIGATGEAVAPPTDITDASGVASATLTVGTKIGTYTVTATATGLTGSPITFTATGTAGSATALLVETKADGTGTVFPTESLVTGGKDTAFAIARDVNSNFVANVTATWSLVNKTGNIADADINPTSGTSTVFTANKTGTTQIQAVASTLTGTSGTITVTSGTARRIKVETKADGTGTVVTAQTLLASRSITVYAISRDTNDNFLGNISANWSLLNKTAGVVNGDLVGGATSTTGTFAIFTGHIPGSASIEATQGALTPTPSGTITVALGTPAWVQPETKADGTGIIVPAQSILASRSITVYAISRDSAENFLNNIAATWSTQNETGGVADNNLTPSGDTKSAVFTGEIIGTGKIRAQATSHTSVLSGTITVLLGTTAKVRVETMSDGTGILVADQTVPSGDSILVYAVTRDSANNFAGSVQADSWSLTNKTGGVVDGDLVASGDRRSAYFKGRGLGSAKIQATSGTLSVVSSGAITVGIGSAYKLVFVQQPSTVVSQAAMSPPVTVRIEDINGNLVAGDGRNVTLSLLNNPAGGTLGGTRTVAASGGLATFGNLSVDKADSTYTLRASSSPALVTDNSSSFIVLPGILSSFTVEDSSGGDIPTQHAGVAFKVRISARDAAGNVVRSFAGTVTVTANGGGVMSVGGGTTLAFTNGVLAAHTVSFNNLGNFSLSVRNTTGFEGGTSNVFAVSAGAAGQLVFVQQPTNATAGATITPAITVQLQDALGNNVNQAGVQVTLEFASGTGQMFGSRIRSTSTSGLALFNNLFIDSAGVKTLRAKSGTLTVAISDSFTIVHGVASKLGFAVNPGAGVAGAPLSIQPVVTLQDQFGNTVPGVSETATLAIQTNPSAGSLGGTRTIAVNTATGQAIFTDLSVDKAGAGYTLTATGQAVSTAAGVIVSAPFDVTAGNGAKLAFTVQPSNAVAGVAISPAIVVQVQDAFGNPVSVNDTLITLSMDSSGSLGGNTSRSTIAGLATFNDIHVDKEGSKVLKANGGGLTGTVSNSFTITPAPASKLAFTTQPGAGISGLPLNPQPVLTLQDAFGNTAKGTAQNVTVSIKDTATTGATLRGTQTVAVNTANGTASFSGLSIDKAGIGYTLTAVGSTVDTAHGVVLSQPFTITAGAATKLRIESLADGKGAPILAQNVSSGFPVSVYAIARDSLNNFVANVPADQWKLIDTAGGAKGTDLAPAGDKKSAAFVGGAIGSSARIVATLTGLKPDTTGLLSVVQPGAAAKILVETAPNGTGTIVPAQTLNSGESITVYSVERDAANNFVGNAPAEAWSVDVISGGVAPGDLVPAADKKSAQFVAHRVGKARIVAASGTLAQAKSDTIRVTPGAAATVAVASGAPDSTRINTYYPSRLVAVVRDSSGNPVQDVLVTYHVPATGASSIFDGDVRTATTDSLGLATSKPLKANTVMGQFADTARVAGLSNQALFVLRNLAGLPHSVTAVGGTPDSTKVATAFPVALTAAVQDSFGNAVDGIPVIFSAPASGPSCTFPGGRLKDTVITNPQGNASVSVFVANIQAGTYAVNATVAGVDTPASFTLINLPGTAGSVTPVAGSPQSATVATAFTTRFKAQVKDGAGNTVSNVLVRFTAPPSGASGKFAGGVMDSALTNSQGIATASLFTADTIAGTYKLTASVDAGAIAEFSLTNTAGTVDTFLVQSELGTDVATQMAYIPFPIRVTALDAFKNVATGFTGTVTITANGPLARGGGKTSSFVAGVLDSLFISAAKADTFIVTSTRTGGAESGKSNSFVVVNPTPTVKSITPSNGLAGQTINVVIIGGGFISGVTTVSFGDQITTSTVVANDSTMNVKITIGAGASLGARSVTVINTPPGGGVAQVPGGFIVGDNPIPTLTSISPDTVAMSQSTKLTIRGTNLLLSSQISFVPATGITVDSVTVIDPTNITLRVTVSNSAALGLHDLIIKTPPPGGGSDTLTGALWITPPGTLQPPALVSPTDGSHNEPTTLSLVWQSAAGATSYDIQVASASTFTTGVVVSDSLITVTSKQVGPLATPQTYYWHVRSRNATGVSAWSSAWSFDNATYPQTYTLNDTVSFAVRANPGDYATSEYELIGLPGASNASLSTFIPGKNLQDWQAYWDDGGQVNYMVPFVEGSSTFTFAAARGFWLIKNGQWIISNQSVATAPLQPSTSAVHVGLHTGWNIITNPFRGQLTWSDVLSANAGLGQEQIHGYKLPSASITTWYTSAFLEPYKGYYVYNDPASPIDTLKLPWNLTIGKPIRKTVVASDSTAWNVAIGLKVGTYRDEDAVLGVSARAGDGRDKMDYHKPRAFAQLPAVYFDRPEWDHYCSTFGSDIRNSVNRIAVWEFTVATSGPKAGNSEISLSGLENVPGQFGVYLIDEAGACYRNLRKEGTTYKFIPAAPYAQFKMLVGNKEALDEELAKVLPRTFALDHNYPNPFNPTTTIPVSVPYTANVTLKIYNIMGQEVMTVYSGSLEPGRHRFTWEGRNNAGIPVASGVYFVRMTTVSGPSFVGKMLLMK